MIQATVHLVATAVVQVGIDMKRIEELKAEAGLYTDTSGRWANADAVDRFAELLIDEVYSFLLSPSLDDEPWPNRLDVRKYFGVKE